MRAPAAVVTHEQEGVLLGPLAPDPLVMERAALHPLGQRSPFVVVRVVVGQPLRIELEFAARGRQRMLLGILAELVQAGRHLLPLGIGRDDVVLLVLEVVPGNDLIELHVVETELDLVLQSHPACELLVEAELLGHFAHGLEVAQRFAERLYRLVLHQGAMDRSPSGRHPPDIAFFQLGIDRQDDVTQDGVVLEPQMLHDDRLDLGAAEGFHGLEAIVPAGGAARVVHPDHVDLGAALFFRDGVLIPLELILKVHELLSAARAPTRAFKDGLGKLGLRDDLLR